MKKRLLVVGLLSTLLLTGCGASNSGKTEKKTQNSEEVQKETAEKDADAVLSYVYKGKSNGIDKVTNQTKDELDQHIINKLKDKQLENYNPDNKLDDYYLIVDGSEYYASEILNDYAKAYLKATQSLGDYKIKEVKVKGNEAQVTAEITPFAGLSEANPIGTLRTELFGGVDEEEFIRKSQNKDIKAIKNLITLKLYSMYYGDAAYVPEKSKEKKEITFTMDKKGDNYMVGNDVIDQLVKDSRDSTYADESSSGNNAPTTDSDEGSSL